MCIQSEYYSPYLHHAADLLFKTSSVNTFSNYLQSLEKSDKIFRRNSNIWGAYSKTNYHLTQEFKVSGELQNTWSCYKMKKKKKKNGNSTFVKSSNFQTDYQK